MSQVGGGLGFPTRLPWKGLHRFPAETRVARFRRAIWGRSDSWRPRRSHSPSGRRRHLPVRRGGKRVCPHSRGLKLPHLPVPESDASEQISHEPAACPVSSGLTTPGHVEGAPGQRRWQGREEGAHCLRWQGPVGSPQREWASKEAARTSVHILGRSQVQGPWESELGGGRPLAHAN